MDDLDVYLPAGIFIILLFILSESYGVSPDGIFHSLGALGQSAASFSIPADTSGFVPALIILGVLGALFIAIESFGVSELIGVGILFFFILLVS